MKLVFEVFINGEINRDAHQIRANKEEMERLVKKAVENLANAVVVSVDLSVKGANE